MKTRFVLALAMILVLFVAGSVSAAAQGPEVPPFRTTILVKPTFVGPLTDPPGIELSVKGYGDVMHLGASTWHADQRMYFGNPYMTINADMVFTADNGDQLSGTYAGWGYTDENGVGHCWGSYQFTGGTGRFKDARGSGTILGTHPPNVYGPLAFDGTLIK